MGRLTAALSDALMALGARGMNPRRRAVVAELRGRVLELGIGTGHNLAHYSSEAWVIGVDPDVHALRRAQRRAASSHPQVRLVVAEGENLPFPDSSLQAVVATLVFCSVRDLARTLGEIHRVLEPDGTLRFWEHVRSETPGWARLQDFAAPLWAAGVG